eukprot:Skav211091  [mRNA]  locus=scaffold2002:327342:329294:- [translate_table: standard]
MNRTALSDHFDSDTNQQEYMSGLGQWELDRSAGKSRPSSKDTVSVVAETKSGLLTRTLKGYLWSKELLDKHGNGHLWKKGKTTTITHMGAKVTGMLREVNVLGAIEIYEDSSCSAVRTNVAAEGDGMDEDVQENANDTFQAMTKQLQGQSVADEEDGTLMLKPSQKKTREDQDDFMELWGVTCGVGGGATGAGSSTDGNRNRRALPTSDSQTDEPRKAKKAKKETSSGAMPIGSIAAPTTSETGSQSGNAGNSLSSSWMFSGRLAGKGRSRGGAEHQKDFDQSDRVIAVVEGLKSSITNPRTVMDKIQNRNTEALQAVYREVSHNGDPRGLDMLRRVTMAESEVQCILNFVAALHDPEASSQTLAQTMAEARGESIAIPKCADVLCRARLLTELAKEKKWAEYFAKMDPASDFGEIVEKDDQNAAMLDFQASSLITTLRSMLMAEVKLPKDKEGEEKTNQDKDAHAQNEKILSDLKWIHIADIFELLNNFEKSPVNAFMKGKPSVALLLEDMHQLQLMISLWEKAQDKPLDAAEVDQLKSARAHLVVNKKGTFYESMTLFPVGMELSGCAAEICLGFQRDKGFAKDLEDILGQVDGFKALTGDALLKKITSSSGEVTDYEVQIPSSSKVFDVVSKLLGFRWCTLETFHLP